MHKSLRLAQGPSLDITLLLISCLYDIIIIIILWQKISYLSGGFYNQYVISMLN